MVNPRKILVTGASRRLGAAMVESLVGRDWRVALHFNSSQDEAHDLASRHGDKVVLVQGDLAGPGGAQQVFQQALSRLGGLDALVNNASTFPEDGLRTMTRERFFDALAINTWAPFELSREFALKAGLPGQDALPCVVNMLDCRMDDLDPRHVAYHWAKRLLRDMTREMALEFAPTVRFNAIAPGAILPPVGGMDDQLRLAIEASPLKRKGEIEDVIRALNYLLDADFVTGQIMYVDGGRHIKGDVYG
jgi:pteridine reductase